MRHLLPIAALPGSDQLACVPENPDDEEEEEVSVD
jgi:hypothetical protein